MGGPPGSQVVQKKSGRPRNTNGHGAHLADGANGSEDVGQHASPSPALFQPPRQPNVHVECVPLRELYDQAGFGGAGARGSHSGGQTRRQQGKRAAATLQLAFTDLPYPRGMVNNSNFCFINSILQALLFIPAFAQLSVCASCDAQARQLCPTLAAFGKWALQYWKPGFTRLATTAPPLVPRTGVGAGGGRAGAPSSAVAPASQRILDGSVQEDAQEYLQKLLERVHEELVAWEDALNAGDASETTTESGTHTTAASVATTHHGGGVAGATAAAAAAASASTGGGGGGEDGGQPPFHQKGWTIVRGKEKLAVREHVDVQGRSRLLASMFGGTLESHLQGKQRQRDRVSVMVESYYCLPVDVGFAPECTIEQALEHTFVTERIYDSEREKNLKKTLRLGRLPSILFLQLRRWAVTREGELVKLDNVVHLKRTLQIPRTICSDETLGNAGRAYRLLSVVCHRGDAVGRGHYVTYLVHHAASPAILKVQASEPGNKDAAIVRSPPDPASVILCNDANVTVCPAKNMEKESMYFLVYQKSV
ncbi:ubiquitin hydrolase [Novymonas esmeraldas]|uniref:ubiquitinyl hydrolase 1 n=1 Tax=Novymonas esmeraldas TaxID=1808958 RepID=A0AAW0F3N8_9TRYP